MAIRRRTFPLDDGAMVDLKFDLGNVKINKVIVEMNKGFLDSGDNIALSIGETSMGTAVPAGPMTPGVFFNQNVKLTVTVEGAWFSISRTVFDVGGAEMDGEFYVQFRNGLGIAGNFAVVIDFENN